jgi:anti-anti-sigma factor
MNTCPRIDSPLQAFTPARITVTEQGPALVIAVTGALDAHAAATMRQPLDEVRRTHPPLVVVELSGVTFVGAAGVGWLLRLGQAVSTGGGQVFIAGAGPQVERLLRLTGIAAVCPVVADVAAATESMLRAVARRC